MLTGSLFGRLAALAVAAGAAGLLLWAGQRRRPALGWTRDNYRGHRVSLLCGPVSLGAVLVQSAALLLVGALAGPAAAESDIRRTALAVVVMTVCAGAAGLYDDVAGDPSAKGFAGHLRALARGGVSTGTVKLFGIGSAALVAAVLLSSGGLGWQVLIDAGVIAGLANLANLFDVRPGRALKVLVAGGLPLALLAPPAAALLAAGPAGAGLALLPADLAERGMLGDGGANGLGGALGVALAAASGLRWSAVVLVALLALTALSEVVSFSRVIEAVPPLRWADRLGRR